MKNISLLLLSTALICSPAMAESSTGNRPETTSGKKVERVTEKSPDKAAQANIQIAILLDISGSMDGLINQARAHIWKIVNELALAKQNGKLPNIEIALYEYGNNDGSSDYMKQVLPLTGDLDAISEALFSLTTVGSDEYCGTVIRKAVNELKWNETDKNALKMIFIAGNEEFTQGNVKYQDAIKEALAKGITVNTILCDSPSSSDAFGWSNGATLGDGGFVCIDHNQVKADPKTPYDEQIARLGADLNKTYLAYGSSSAKSEKVSRPLAQDSYAGTVSESVMVERAKSKSSANYKNSEWDLVDAMEEQSAPALKELEKKDMLPDELKGKTPEEQEKIIKEKAEQRNKIQADIKELSGKRDQWLIDNAPKESDKDSLDDAVIKSLRKQAENKQFVFDKN